jgi:histidine triad (HIT) family protein
VDLFDAPRAGLIVAGYEINHLHVHVWPSRSMADFNFASADQNPDPAVLDANAEKLRRGLRDAGWGEFVPAG